MNGVKTSLLIILLLNISIIAIIFHSYTKTFKEYKHIKNHTKTIFLIYLIGICIWIAPLFLNRVLFQNLVEYKSGTNFYLLEQILFLGPVIFLSAQTWFFKTYNQKTFQIKNLLDYFLIIFTAIITILVFTKNTIFTSITTFPEGYNEVTTGTWAPIYTTFILFQITYALYLAHTKSKTQKNKIENKQLQTMFYLCLFCNTGGALTNWILPTHFDYSFLNATGPTFFIMIAIAILYSIQKTRFLDLRIIFAKHLTFLTNTLLFAIPAFGILKTLATKTISPETAIISLIALTLAAILMWKHTLTVFNKLYNQLFFHKNQNPIQEIRQSITNFSHSITEGLDTLSHALHTKHSKVIFITNEKTTFTKKAPHLIHFFQENPTPIVKEELTYQLKNFKKTKEIKEAKEIAKEMETYMIAVAIPVLDNKKNLLGILLLEEKIDGNLFSTQEIQETKTLLQNATIYITKEHKYQEIKEKLKDATKIKKQFIDGLFHEIRNPLMLAQNTSEIIDWAKLKPEDQKFLTSSQGNLRDLNQTLNRVQEVIAWENKLISTNQTLGTIENLLKFITKELKPQYPNIQKQIKIQTTKDLKTKLFQFDFHYLATALKEIIKNALFFNNKENKQITIDIKKEKNNITIDITDNGIGIEKTHWQDIFKLLHVLSQSRNPKECGIGTGLTLTKEIIKAHKGQIKILTSKPNKGTTIRTTLPFKQT